jgi:hypothetical protein
MPRIQTRPPTLVTVTIALLVSAAQAWGARALPPHLRSQRVVRIDRETIVKKFGSEAALLRRMDAARAREWKPSADWLATQGKRYGRLIFLSDTHPATGRNRLTGSISPAEAFLPDKQEVDMRGLFESEWQASSGDGTRHGDGRVRTVVMNGDELEFMLTSRLPPRIRYLPDDPFTPANTARNARYKLEAIREGHRDMFMLWAQHLVRGHRLVLLPGNHDRALLHPAVRLHLRTLLRKDIVQALKRDAQFHPRLTGRERHRAAMEEAHHILNDQLEFEPLFFLHGDVFARHGDEHDPQNVFSTWTGDYYAPLRSLDRVMENTAGDSYVNSLFSGIDAKLPWGDNSPGTWTRLRLTYAFLSKHKLASLSRMARAGRYIATQGGRGNKAEMASLREQDRADIAQAVRDTGLVAKLNQLRGPDEQLTEQQAIELMQAYRSRMATPVMNLFRAGSSVLWRAAQLVVFFPQLGYELREQRRYEIEEATHGLVFGAMRAKTRVTGHDHKDRMQRFLVDQGDSERLGHLYDPGSWIDFDDDSPKLATRGLIARFAAGIYKANKKAKAATRKNSDPRRAVVTVDFDEDGSHANYMYWDGARRQLVRKSMVDEAGEE